MYAQSMDRRHIYGGGIAGAGLILTIVQVVQGVQQLDGFDGTTSAVVFTFETLPFVLIGVALAFVGYWLSTHPEYEPDLPRIVAWSVGSTILFASIAALTIFSQQVTVAGDTLTQAPYVVVNNVTIGAVVGVLVGMYDSRSRMRQRELERERDRVEQFAEKAADINNYGRELNRSTSIEEVSSLCIQAVGAFLGLNNVAFVSVNDDGTIVDDTTVGVSDESLIALAYESLDQERATVVVHDSSSAGIDGRWKNAITLLVTEYDDSAVVLVALTDETEFDEEDVQLLEMLVAHAATSLDRLGDGGLVPRNEHP